MVSTGLFDILAAIVLLIVALLGAYAPVLLSTLGKKSGTERSLAYVLGNMLSAGVMISAGFVHLLGAAVADLDTRRSFPLAPFLCGLGFILTLVADHTAERLSRKSGWSINACSSAPIATQTSEHAHEPSLQKDEDSQTLQLHSPGSRSPKSGTPKSSQLQRFDIESPPRENGNSMYHDKPMAGLQSTAGSDQRGPQKGVQSNSNSLSQSDQESLIQPGSLMSSEIPPLRTSVSADSNGGRSLEALAAKMGVSIPDVKPVSFLTAVLMAVALCFHSILEGMAMGAQASVVDTVHIFIAIIAHKGLAAYALGSSIVDSGASKLRFWVVIAIFALATPAGIGLGRIVASVSESGPAAALSALASGTFLYVAFMEVIPKEMQSPRYGFVKLGMLCLGFGMMSLLAIWA